MTRQATAFLLIAALAGCAINPAVPDAGTLERVKYDQRRELTRQCMHNVHEQRSRINARMHYQPVASQCRALARRAVP